MTRPTILERLALHRPELRAWAMYDWANSAFITVIVTAVWPIYFKNVASAGIEEQVATARHGYFTAGALALVAIMAPILGAIADRAPIKKKFLGAFVIFGAAATAGLAAVGTGDWILGGVLFALGNIGASASFVFYDALLPHIASDDEVDRVSIAGYALGYVGGGLLLVVLLVMMLQPEMFGLTKGAATRIGFVVVAVWWLLFSIPLFRRVPEPPVARALKPRDGNVVTSGFRELAHTFRELRKYRQATLFLIAFLIYNDGVGTIIRMATIYGDEKNLPLDIMIGSIVVVQFVGIPFTFLFGQLAGKIGTRTSIYVGLVAYCGVSVLGYFMTTAWHFIALAALVGMVQGGVQALSRSLFSTLIPAAKSGEFFALFAVFEKFAGIFGPLLFAVVISATGDSQNAILAIISFFIFGGYLLSRVDVKEGQRTARTTEVESQA